MDILESASPVNDFVALDIDATVLHPRELVPEPTGMFVRDVAVANNIPVVFITAREESEDGRDATMAHLADIGITNPLLVILKPSHVQTWEGISRYKAGARAYIEKKTNSRCVMNVGDQWTDLMPLTNSTWRGLNRTFRDQYLLFAQPRNDEVERWSVKLKEYP